MEGSEVWDTVQGGKVFALLEANYSSISGTTNGTLRTARSELQAEPGVAPKPPLPKSPNNR